MPAAGGGGGADGQFADFDGLGMNDLVERGHLETPREKEADKYQLSGGVTIAGKSHRKSSTVRCGQDRFGNASQQLFLAVVGELLRVQPVVLTAQGD